MYFLLDTTLLGPTFTHEPSYSEVPAYFPPSGLIQQRQIDEIIYIYIYIYFFFFFFQKTDFDILTITTL